MDTGKPTPKIAEIIRFVRKPSILGTTETVGDMGVSKNRGTPKWMVYNRKPY